MCKSVLPSPKSSLPKRTGLRDITISAINQEDPLEADLLFDDFTIERFDHLNEENEAGLLSHEEEGQRRQTPAQGGVRHASSRLMSSSIVKK